MANTAQEISPKSRAVAAILCFFFGVIGVHRFYVGKVGSGIAMLLLTITFFLIPISAIWGLIDFIVILIGNFRDKEHKLIYNWSD